MGDQTTKNRNAKSRARTTPATTTITIRTTDGARQVIATVFGAWAVHEPYANTHIGRRQWHITHVASGMRVPDGYLDDCSKREVLQIAKAIDDEIGNCSVTPRNAKRIQKAVWRALLRSA